MDNTGRDTWKSKVDTTLKPKVSREDLFRARLEDCQRQRSEFNVVSGETRIIVAFKRLKETNDPRHKEPWLNRWCVFLTSKHDDVLPGGRMSHVEIMMENNGKWYKFSIVKATIIAKPDGTFERREGRVHCLPVKDGDMRNYDYFEIFVPREKQERAWRFLKSQVNGGFNLYGYALNFFLPMPLFGCGNFRECRGRNKWFCSEIVCCALQAAEIEPFTEEKANALSPNSLYRLCVRFTSFGMPCMNPTYQQDLPV